MSDDFLLESRGYKQLDELALFLELSNKKDQVDLRVLGVQPTTKRVIE
jgi:hypothetical protein